MAKITEDLIQFVGMHELRMDESERVKELAEQYFPKIKRELHNLTRLVVNVKLHNEAGARRKYSMHAQVVSPGKNFESNNQVGFDISTVCHQAFGALIREIQHTYHAERSRPARE